MKRLKRYLWFFFLLLFPSLTHATTNRFSIHHVRPSATETTFHIVYGSQGLFHLEWQAGTMADYAFRPLNGSTRRIIDRIITQNFFAGIGFFDRLSLGINMPVAWLNHFQSPQGVAAPGFSNHLDLGDLRVDLKGELLSRYRYPIGLAVVPFVHVPLGNQQHFVGDSRVATGGLVVVDMALSRYLTFALNGGLEWKERVDLSNVDLNPLNLLLGVGAVLHAAPWVDLTTEGYAKTPTENLFQEEAETPVEVLGSARFKPMEGLVLSAGGGGGIVYGVGAPRIRGFLKVAYVGTSETNREKKKALFDEKFPPKQAPVVEWAVIQLKKNCPEDPAAFNPEVHDPGCQKFYRLKEVASLSLICPSQASDFDPTVHDAGCPKVYQLRGELSEQEYATVYVLAAEQLGARCPENPTDFDPAKHDPSCPKFFEIRETVSLVARCPEKSKDFDPEIHDAGCPKVYNLKQQYSKAELQAFYVLSQSDLDKDGILDLEDRCPEIAGIAALFGCPESLRRFEKGQIVGTRVPITFAFNQWRINTEIGAALNEVCEIMNNHPEIKRVRIEGHADIQGTQRANRLVSRRRAEGIKRFLESCGVPADRLKAVWFGAKKPVASNKTPEGRSQNRRATVLVVDLVE